MTDQSNVSQTDSVDIKIDNKAPSIKLKGPKGRVNSGGLELSFDVSDDSNVTSLGYSVYREGNSNSPVKKNDDVRCSGSSCSKSIDLDSSKFSQGARYIVHISAEDALGNYKGLGGNYFVYDDRYEADMNPTVTPSPQVFRASDREYDFSILVENGTEKSEVTVECKMKGNGWRDAGSYDITGERKYTCSYNPDQDGFVDITKDFKLRLSDAAGNTHTVDVGEYTFDFSSPKIGNLSTVVGVFNDDFKVSYEANDPTLGGSVKSIHYQMDEFELDLNTGRNFSDTGSFNVDVSNLTSGNYTLHVWAMDQAGRWSNYATLDFDYRPYAEPHATVKVQDRKEITSGETGSVKVNVTNTGKLLIEGMKLNVGGDLYNRSLSVGSLKPGRSEVLNVSLPTEPRDMGRHTVTFSTESPDVSTSMDLIVRANEEQRKKIKQKYQKWRSRYKRLHTNVSELQQAIGGSWERQLEGNFSGFNETIQQATEAKITGNYYKVSNALQGIREKYAQAREAFNTVQEKYRSAQTTQMVLTLFLVSFGVVGIVAGYVYFSDDYYLDLDALTGHEAVRSLRESDYGELAAAKLGSAAERISEFIEEEEEEAESGFQGFT
ncbi:MAG: hypothetical protein ABEK01_00915 [Candidatus Nanohaloarchaea archaeon]